MAEQSAVEEGDLESDVCLFHLTHTNEGSLRDLGDSKRLWRKMKSVILNALRASGKRIKEKYKTSPVRIAAA